ncbi:MAG: hypothetical protein ACOZB0_06060 [Pseudomonadota bacterium]
MTSLKSDLILAAFVLALASAGPAWSASQAGADTTATTKPSSAKKTPSKKATAKKSTSKKVVAKPRPNKVAAKKPAAVRPAAQPDTGSTLTAEVTSVAAVASAALAAPVMVASASETTLAAPVAPVSTNPYLAYVTKEPGNPYLTAAPATPAEARNLGADLRALLPSLPGEGQSFLPSIKKVYPTGEKPLVVITFKCPTELVGVTPPPVKLLHSAVDGSFNALNATDWLSFDLQQVCQ